jgi:hypothetical protein
VTLCIPEPIYTSLIEFSTIAPEPMVGMVFFRNVSIFCLPFFEVKFLPLEQCAEYFFIQYLFNKLGVHFLTTLLQ